jgi:multidrug transporter EmrE-like cation transporter
LANAPLSKAYPFALAGAALVPVASWLILREPLSPQIAIGMALVIAGLAVIQFG